MINSIHLRTFEIPEFNLRKVNMLDKLMTFDKKGFPTINGVRIETNNICPPYGLIYDFDKEVDDYPFGWEENKVHLHPKYNIWLFNFNNNEQELKKAMRRMWIYKNIFPCLAAYEKSKSHNN